MCLVIATVLALTTHIYISQWAKPFLDMMMQGFQVPPSSAYSSIIMYAAYGTACITIGLQVFLWYHAQHLLPIKSNLAKAFLLTCIILELKGYLIRQPIMDILVAYSMGMQGLKPFAFVGLNMIDKWVSAILIALALVYLCPKKYKNADESRQEMLSEEI